MATVTPGAVRRSRAKPRSPCPFPPFASWLPNDWLAARLRQLGWRGRRRAWDPAATLGALVEQALGGGASQVTVASALAVRTGADCSPTSGALSRAVNRLQRALLSAGAARVATRAAALAPLLAPAGGRPVYLLDGVYLRLADTALNRAAFPRHGNQRHHQGWPLAHLAVLVEARTGCVVASAWGCWNDHAAKVARPLWDALPPGAIVVADCAFAASGFVAYLTARGVDVVCAQHQRRRNDTALVGDQDDRVATWRRPSGASRWWDCALPPTLAVRVIRQRVGERVLCVTTTLAAGFDTAAVLALYAGRWPVEARLRELKQELGGDLLAVGTPGRVQRQWAALTLTHNLLGAGGGEAAARAGVR